MLALRAFHPSIRRSLHKQLYTNQLPIIRKSLTISGVLVILWVLSLYGILIGIWWLRLRGYFVTRGEQGGMMNGNRRVAAVALTGHICDVTMGMVLLPVARNSALSSFFRLSASTTYAFHMIQAYVLFALVVVHGLLYASWVAAYNHARNLAHLPSVFPVLNPTYLYHEVWPGNTSSLGIWRASLIFTGFTTSLIMLAVFITTFPVIRRKHFNVFYFTHLLMIIAVVVICLHASTMFYCTAPGLAMWILDWGMRIYELSGKMDSTLVAVGKGWFCLNVPLPRNRLKGCACHSPLAHFHIHHTESSIREIHPFTTITHLASQKLSSSDSDKNIMIQFLFRKSKASSYSTSMTEQTPERRLKRQWTNKLADLVDEVTIDLSPPSEKMEESDLQRQRLSTQYQTTLRLEGPYFTPANPASYDTVICLVAGTGVTGAIAIAAAFRRQSTIEAWEPETTMFGHEKIHGAPLERNFSISSFLAPSGAASIWKRCVVVWSVREADFIDLPFWHVVNTTPGLEVRAFLTGKGRDRLNMDETIGSIMGNGGRTWVYISGPNPFIEAGEKACRRSGVDFFGARSKFKRKDLDWTVALTDVIPYSKANCEKE
ncbi:hypothetical protein HO133_006443 [Letharia lupina]|uniref:Ferric oxidoreductase domain-containing protein n=1 Tax=Letharia lupina TaxID=560253 RepID=A0A8H6F7P5_9LECA|nr:uncharacterized protein HO133_006443 [Letharia lupina]KAF6218031.1 hypothetical protein HO133_006443 [Letharia lupina]